MSSDKKRRAAYLELSSDERDEDYVEEDSSVKRPRTSPPTDNTSSLDDLPEEILRKILVFVQPKKEHKRWEWADTIGLTCKTFLGIARDLGPKSLELIDFYNYNKDGRFLDLRRGALDALRTSRWKGSSLVELHVSWNSILNMHIILSGDQKWNDANDEILSTLKQLLSTPGVLPKMTWLDISVMSDHLLSYNLVDATLLQAMPLALPSLARLCLAGCFRDSSDEVSPSQLKRFAQALNSNLKSLSLAQVHWMSDEHVAAFLPVVGRSLTRLELIDCLVFSFDEEIGDAVQERQLTDDIMTTISQECHSLESLSIAGTHITSSGLAKVLKANDRLCTLDLSDNNSEGFSDAAGVIAKHAPNIVTLRNYWGGTRIRDWLDDEGITTIVDGQMKACKGKGIALQTIGLVSGNATNEGISYALARGMSTIEANDPPPGFQNSQKFRVQQLACEFPNARFVDPAYPNFIDGSIYRY